MKENSYIQEPVCGNLQEMILPDLVAQLDTLPPRKKAATMLSLLKSQAAGKCPVLRYVPYFRDHSRCSKRRSCRRSYIAAFSTQSAPDRRGSESVTTGIANYAPRH